MVSEVKQISSQAVPLLGNDIDTDRIIPARYLKAITFDDLREGVFVDTHLTKSNTKGQISS